MSRRHRLLPANKRHVLNAKPAAKNCGGLFAARAENHPPLRLWFPACGEITMIPFDFKAR
jgi:hypothetical protein